MTNGEHDELQAHLWLRPNGRPRRVAMRGGDPRSHLSRHSAQFLVDVIGGQP